MIAVFKGASHFCKKHFFDSAICRELATALQMQNPDTPVFNYFLIASKKTAFSAFIVKTMLSL